MDWQQITGDVLGSLGSRWPLIPMAAGVFYWKEIWGLARTSLPKFLPKGGDPVIAGLDAKFESCSIDDCKLIGLLQDTKQFYESGLKKLEQSQ